jgi:acetyl-CoA carboxylase biotin carboxyl carrier protein
MLPPRALETLARPTPDGGIELLAPNVGWLRLVVRTGDLLHQGQRIASLDQLGQVQELVVPPGVSGQVRHALPTLRHQPVAYGEPILHLSSLEGSVGQVQNALGAPSRDGIHAVSSPQSGRFYQRPSPEAEPFVVPGQILQPGDAIGLLEVMKTFAQVRYGEHQTAAARALRYLKEDGADVARGTPLLELAPVGEDTDSNSSP